MNLPFLKQGSRGKYVGILQTFLRGSNHYTGEIDNDFGPRTHRSVRRYQKQYALKVDGKVGSQTWGHFMLHGLELVETPAKEVLDTGRESRTRDRKCAAWPLKPKGLAPLYGKKREAVFGHIDHISDPHSRNPERIRIINDWQKENLTKIFIPQLKTLHGKRGSKMGFPSSGNIFCHKLAAIPLQGLFQSWEEWGVLDLVLSYAGSWVPRYVRGSRTTLSNHAYGTAIDINVPWNLMGRRPALLGDKGSVRELVPAMNRYGFYWGGHFKRRDGMHIELVSVERARKALRHMYD